jgi:2-keto-4-pentenoate hydratase/2-oxohepta-3-ene-1,7-dioic acid hydratase in catechol pathway
VDHAREMDAEVPDEPLLFLKPSTAVIGPGDPIPYPSLSTRVDPEAEMAVVVGRLARRVRQEDASAYILGYTCGNDVTARDLQRKDGQWTRGKGFDGFCPLGPWIETEFDPIDVAVEGRVNGATRQAGRTSQLTFGPAFLLEYITQVMTLLPGDVVMTGTPSGIAPVSVGDVIEVEVEGIGVLENPVVDGG